MRTSLPLPITILLTSVPESQGSPAHPPLEMLFRQVSACVQELGLLGVGEAAFADVPGEFLDA